MLLRIGEGGTYRQSLESPPLVVRGGLVYELAPRPTGEGPSIDGTSALQALRVVGNAVCRPPQNRRAPPPAVHTPPFGPPGGPPY